MNIKKDNFDVSILYDLDEMGIDLEFATGMKRNKKKIKGINDPILFKNLKTETMNIKKEHTKMLGDFIVEQGYKIKEGKRDKTFTEVFDIIKTMATQIKTLKESYGK